MFLLKFNFYNFTFNRNNNFFYLTESAIMNSKEKLNTAARIGDFDTFKTLLSAFLPQFPTSARLDILTQFLTSFNSPKLFLMSVMGTRDQGYWKAGTKDIVHLIINEMLKLGSVETVASRILAVAIVCANIDVVKFFYVNQKLPINYLVTKDMTGLHVAVWKNRKEIVSFFFSQKADVNTKKADGVSILHTAVSAFPERELMTVSLLLGRGANVNCVTKNLMTPLHAAISKGNLMYVKILLEFGANLYDSSSGETPFHYAVELGKLEIVRYLAQNNNVNCKDKNNRTPLHKAAELNNVKMIEILLHNGANPEVKSTRGEQALHVAIAHGHLESVVCLLERKINVNAKCEDGQTALHMAVEKNHLQIVDKLMASKPQVNCTNEKDETPLLIATRNNNFKIAACLLKHGARVNVADQDSMTPLHWVCKNGDMKMFKLILSCKKSVLVESEDINTPLYLAAKHNKLGIVEELLDLGADVNAQNSEGETPIFGAASNLNVEVVSKLLEYNANINLHPRRGTTLFTIAELSTAGYQSKKYYKEDYSTRKQQFDQVLVKHVVKLMSMKSNVKVEYLNVIGQNESLEKLRGQCEREISRMKKGKIVADITLFDFFAKSVNQLKPFYEMQSDCIIRALESKECKREFPIYGDLMCNHFKHNLKMFAKTKSKKDDLTSF